MIPEENTRLAQLRTGQVQIGEVSRELHGDAKGAGLQVIQSQLPAIQMGFVIGGVYTPMRPALRRRGGGLLLAT